VLRTLRQKPIVVLTHRRSGTHLVIDLLRRQFEECDSWKWWGEGNGRLYVSLDAQCAAEARPRLRTAVRILRRCRRPLIKTHRVFVGGEAPPLPDAVEPHDEWKEWLERDAQVVYVYRDGRDVLTSLQLLEAKRDPSNWRPHAEFLRQRIGGINRVRLWARHVEAGLALPDVIPIAFEELVADPRQALAVLSDRLGMRPRWVEPLLPRRFASIWESRRARLFARRPESTAILGRPGEHAPFDWRDVYTAADRAFFHEQAGDALIRLGYERSDAWVDAG
jgi:hypothetical protein